MRNSNVSIAAAGILCILLTGCNGGQTGASARSAKTLADISNPAGFLRWSMDQYKAAPGLSATCAYMVSVNGKTIRSGVSRSIDYAGPNRFKVTISYQGTPRVTCVSDGSRFVEYTLSSAGKAMYYPAPPGIAEANSSFMEDPINGAGSLVYQFFEGSPNYANVVDENRGPITFGDEATAPNGEASRFVKFYGKGNYGHVQMLIGEKTGFVYRVDYDSEPFVKMMSTGKMADAFRKQANAELAKMPAGPEKTALAKKIDEMLKPHQFESEESYSDYKVAGVLDPNLFATSLPKGVVALNDVSQQASPVPLGQPAPVFSAKSLDGKTVSLKSLKGHVVLVDFWATYCGPCKKGLPVTASLAQEGAAKGLKVLAVSAEPEHTVTSFLSNQPYRLPAYLESGAASRAYNVDAIPTTVVIDAKGNVSDYFVGLQSPQTIRDALKKAGMDL